MTEQKSPHALHGQEKAQYVAGMFARISRRYDLLNTVMTGGMHHRWRRLTARLAVEGLEGRPGRGHGHRRFGFRFVKAQRGELTP